MRDLMRYDLLTQDALRGVVIAALKKAATEGLPGTHHFFISFATTARGVVLSDALKASYPDEMTIVIQHQYWDLVVEDDHFEVSLSFNKMPERLIVPFTAIRSFVDPSVKFGLQFQGESAEGAPEAAPAAPLPAKGEDAEETPDKEEQDTGEVVSLDAFRKK